MMELKGLNLSTLASVPFPVTGRHKTSGSAVIFHLPCVSEMGELRETLTASCIQGSALQCAHHRLHLLLLTTSPAA